MQEVYIVMKDMGEGNHDVDKVFDSIGTAKLYIALKNKERGISHRYLSIQFIADNDKVWNDAHDMADVPRDQRIRHDELITIIKGK